MKGSCVRFALLLLPLLVLTGCASSLELLRSVNPPADDFGSALAAEYLGYADSESEQGLKASAEYYADKGLQASRGEAVEPEQPDATLPKPAQAKLAAARSDLVEVLKGNLKISAPQKLARAQLLFDCWQHQLVLHRSPELCAQEFATALSEVREVAEDEAYGEGEDYQVRFAPGSALPDEETLQLVEEIADDVKDTPNPIVEMAGHEVHSPVKQLGQRRLDALKKAFIKHGVAASSLRTELKPNGAEVCLDCAAEERDPDMVILTVKTLKKAQP